MTLGMRRPEDVEELPAVGGAYRITLSGADTGGRLAVVEMRLAAGALGAAPHVHHGHEEDFVVLDGEIAFDTGDGDVVVGAGGSVAVPRGSAHGFRNATGEPARCLMILTPAGYEDYFREVSALVAAGHEPTAAELDELRARFRTTPA
ncbi:cupin domain-containing protein [Saccharothrix syringae]|uniref:Cupin domain-containing protein n=1 Tax=Saccharothrix syringae TaxID=103733 RepID=A0A5Q0H571_SACSY|nr:cupin domain-containing protein [Saccharothrix syringae]QFZ20882.1 cupin domain-containing protein [Saccharothrix syringae]